MIIVYFILFLYKEKTFLLTDYRGRFLYAKVSEKMDIKQIAHQASQLKDKGGLLVLLNQIKKAEIEDMGHWS